MYDCPGIELQEELCTEYAGCFHGCSKVDADTGKPLKKSYCYILGLK